MISSSDFFRNSFFHPDEKSDSKAEAMCNGKKESIDPWCYNEEIPWETVNKGRMPERAVKLKQKNVSKQQKQNIIVDINSNLFPSKKATELPPLAVSPSLPPSPTPFMVKNSLSNFHQKQSKEQQARRQKTRYQEISILDFLKQQRKELSSLRVKEKGSFSPKNEDQFLVRRNSRKAYFKENQSKTLNLKRQLQIYERKSIVSLSARINDQKMHQFRDPSSKYKPLKSERYKL